MIASFERTLSCYCTPQSRAPRQGTGAPRTSGYENPLGEIEGCWKPRHTFKGPMHRLKLIGTYRGLQHKDTSLGGIRDIQWETELYSFRMRAGGIAVPVLSPPPAQQRGRHHLYCVESSPHTDKSEPVLTWWTPLALLWWLTETLPYSPCKLPRLFRCLSLTGIWQVVAGLRIPVHFAKWLHTYYWWQSVLISIMASLTCLQGHYRKLTTTGWFVAPTR